MVKEIHPVYQRMGELWHKQRNGGLTRAEQMELHQCLDWNVSKCRKLAELHNLSYAAHVVDDTDWQHEICANIDELLGDYF